jgi:hypothetical protein
MLYTQFHKMNTTGLKVTGIETVRVGEFDILLSAIDRTQIQKS